jgi:aminopeptidase N
MPGLPDEPVSHSMKWDVGGGQGASVLRMLCEFLGKERFLTGIKNFIHNHQYGNASQEDLWRAIQATAG